MTSAPVIVTLTPSATVVVSAPAVGVVEVDHGARGKTSVVLVPSPTTSVVEVDRGSVGPAGPAGPAGADGEAGPPGSGGGDGGIIYEHIQSAPAAVWLITHNLGHYPGGVTLLDSSKRIFQAEITYIDGNTIIASMVGAQSGTAYVN